MQLSKANESNKATTTMPDSDESVSSSKSDRSHDYESDLDDVYDDSYIGDGDADAGGSDGNWTYAAHSSRGAKLFEGLSTRLTSSDDFELLYNFADPILLDKTKVEVRHSLEAIKRKLRLKDETDMDVVDAFAGAMPEPFLVIFHEWLKAGHDAKNRTLAVSFVDIIEFLRCEMLLRVFGVSSSLLTSMGISPDQFKRYKRVHDAMKVADMPAATRHAKTMSRSNGTFTFAGPAAETFDPIMNEVVDAINLEWMKTFFVCGESWIDIDDDKLNNTSPKMQAIGLKRTPTKEKKLKPVNHIAATVGTGHICRVTPDTIGLKLGEMLKETIKKLCPNEAQRSTLGLFLDRGYLELAKAQHVDVTNLIQIICNMNCKFLGTVKDSAKFPFIFVEVNEDGKTILKKRSKIQLRGQRTFWSACSKSATGKTMQASVLRHGAGKKRGAKIVTNMPEAMTGAIVYETSASSELKRQEHASPPEAPLCVDATNDEEITYAWQVFLSSLYIISLLQRTVDWFLGRLFCFTSTTFHAAINVIAADYYNTPELQQLHRDILQIVQLTPTRTVTFENAADLEEEDLPSQRGSHARFASSNAMHQNTTVQFWKNKPRDALKKACDENGVEYPDFTLRSTTRNVLAGCLAQHFQQLAAQRVAETGTRVVADDDAESNKKATVALLCRMVPYWFPKPFKSNAGGAIDQGSANESLIVDVLKQYLEKFSEGKYTSKEVKDFGLVARRDNRACASSPDGVFPLLCCDDDDIGNTQEKFLSLCGLEIKTRSAVNSTAELYKKTLKSGKWVECDSGTKQFREAVPDHAYRSQICQHAAALGLDYVLIVFCLPGSHPMRMVLVRVCEEHRAKLVKIERLLSTKYMPFAYDDESACEIPSLGEDYSYPYGYAQEHDTLELWLRIWVAYNKDLFKHGTPTSCKRLIDVATCLWNKFMGNVDTVRRVVTTARAKRGRETGPCALYWSHLLDYIFYQAFRVHQHSSIDLASITSRKQFLLRRRRGSPFHAFLFQLHLGLTAEKISHYFPGLQAKIDHMQPKSITTLSSTELNEATGAIWPRNDQRAASISPPDDHETRSASPEGYKKLHLFLQPNTEFYMRRLDGSLPHMPYQSTNTESDGTENGSRRKRRDCILCCSICDIHTEKPSTEVHSRRGRKAVDYCETCRVYLCKKCFQTFHTKNPLIPPCCSDLDPSARSRRTRSSASRSHKTPNSPTTVSRKPQSQAPSSPRGTISSRLLAGRKADRHETLPSCASRSRRRKMNSPEASDGRRVRPRLLYPANDVPSPTNVTSPPKVSRGKLAGLRAMLPW
eukprot:scaffold176_cov69-Skeletonema_menzelii.AAC.1